MHIWKTIGYKMVVYLASITGIDNSLYEAAVLDGASKYQQAKYITIPSLRPIIIMMFILAIGGIFSSDFGLFYQVSQGAQQPLTPVVATLDVKVYQMLTSGTLRITSLLVREMIKMKIMGRKQAKARIRNIRLNRKLVVGLIRFRRLRVSPLTALTSVMFTALMGYVLSRTEHKLNNFLTILVFIPMVFGGGMTASYVINTQVLHLFDTMWILILPLMVSSFNVTIARTFFRTTIPDGIIESAKIDGARSGRR